MSMLAERKTKQRWTLNPNGKGWSDDSSKFGQKMLEKMGWSRGKGLGAKENGITEHVKVSFKNDSKGLGFKETDTQWTEHTDTFNSLLQSLSDETKDGPKLKSLEKMSESSKARVHYRKFMRGKDLSGRSEKDLANIFGRKTLAVEETKPAKAEIEEEKKEEPKNEFMIHGGSMLDYFKKKLPSFGKTNGYVVGSNGVLKKAESSDSSESKDEVRRKKKRKASEVSDDGPEQNKIKEEDSQGFSNPAFDPLYNNVEVQRHVLNTIEENGEEEGAEEPPKKRKKLGGDEASNILQDAEGGSQKKKRRSNINSDEENCGDLQAENVTKKKKKKSKDKKQSSTDDTEVEQNVVSTVQENGGESGECSKAVKKKKKKLKNSEGSESVKNDNLAVDNPIFHETIEEDSCIDVSFDVKREVTQDNSAVSGDYEVKRKAKKGKKEDLAIDNPNFTELNEDECHTGVTNGDFEVKRKAKKCKNLVVDNSNFTKETAEESIEVKKKKKKNCEIANPTFTESPEDENHCSVVNGDFEVKRKAKKSKSSTNGNPDSNHMIEDESCVSSAESSGVEKKKKKKNQEIDNPNFSESPEDDNHSSIVNGDFEVERKTKKSKKCEDSAVDNPNFAESSEDHCSIVNGDFEVKRKAKKCKNLTNDNSNEVIEDEAAENSGGKKKKKKNLAIDNPNFSESPENDNQSSIVSGDFEVKRKAKKSKKSEDLAIDNPNFDDSSKDENCDSRVNGNYEVKRKTKKNKADSLALDNPNFVEAAQEENCTSTEDFQIKKKKNKLLELDRVLSESALEAVSGFSLNNTFDSGLMLNVGSTPIQSRDSSTMPSSLRKANSVRSRKSVRFSEVHEERIIPNKEDIAYRNELFEINSQVIAQGIEDEKRKNGKYDGNSFFGRHSTSLEQNIQSMSKKIDGFQAEIENDQNEAKLNQLIGEVGEPDGDNEKLPDGTKLKFKFAKFEKSLTWNRNPKCEAQAGYKHLINGDILVQFNNTNLHQIRGYGVDTNSE